MGHPKLTGDELDRRFLKLAAQRKGAQLRKMLAAYPHLLETRWDQRTALTEALRWDGGNPCARLLLEAGADPNASRLDDPQWRPLRMALRNDPALVPELLARGAKPQGVFAGRYHSDSIPDLVVAAHCCPQHIGPLIAAGADPNAYCPGDHSALGYLLGQIHRGNAKDKSVAAQWGAVRTLVDAGATLQSSSQFHGPDMFYFWKLRFSNIDLPDDGEAIFSTLQSRIDMPGLRHQGQTFAHTIAQELRVQGRGERQQRAWQGLLESYGKEQVGQWLALAPDAPNTAQNAFAELVPKPPEDKTDPYAWTVGVDRLCDALEWADEFQRAGANPNEANGQGRSMARVIALNWPWTVLREERVREGIRRLGLDLHRATPEASSAADIFANSAQRVASVQPEPGELDALLLNTTCIPNSQQRARARL